MTDFDRPLNERGKKNAPEMAVRLHDRGIRIDLLVSSPAKRAQQTAKAFQKILAIDSLEFRDELYLAAPHIFTTVIQSLPAAVQTVAIFAHNPGITEFANQLSSARIDNMPTAAIFAVELNVDDWSAFSMGDNRFMFFDYPKSIQ